MARAEHRQFGSLKETGVMRRGFEEILQLARTAAQWNLDSEKDYEAFREFADEVGIKEAQLAYYLNASVSHQSGRGLASEAIG